MVLVFYFSIIKEHSGSKYGMCLGIFTNTFAEQGGANHGGEGRHWTGASSSLPCHPRQQVTINGLSSCQQVKNDVLSLVNRFSLHTTHVLRVYNVLSIHGWSEVKPAEKDDVIYDKPLIIVVINPS